MNAKERTEKLVKSVVEAKEARITTVEKDYILNLKYRDGFTIKQLCEDAHLIPKTARNYIHELMDEGRVKDTGNKAGRAPVYIHTDFLNDAQEQAIEKAQTAKETEKKEDVVAGREFKDSRSITSVVTGDVSWISSRSGNGLFFRYLILVVHPYKATCANVFPEGHEAVNVNDPNFIYIGQDPENKERLYVDLTNICQRRFSAFGERCMHVAPDRMTAVTKRLGRLFKVEASKEGSEEIQKLQESLKKAVEAKMRLEADNGDLKKRNRVISEKLIVNDSAVKKIKEENDQLQGRYAELVCEHNNQTREYERIKSLCSDPNLQNDFKALLREHKALESANENVKADLESYKQKCKDRELENAELKKYIQGLEEKFQAYKNEPRIPTDVYLQAEVTRLRSLMASERRHNHDLMVLASAMAGAKCILTEEVDDGEEESGEA